MQLASEMHWIRGLEHCQDTVFILFTVCLLQFFLTHPNFRFLGKRLIGPP